MLVALLLGYAAGWYVWSVRKLDDFDFLAERPLIASGIANVFSGGGVLAHDAGFAEYRAYSWDEDYATVKSRVVKELASDGFRVVADKPEFTSWDRKDGWSVQIMLGRSGSRIEALTGKRPRDPAGITVFVQNPAPENAMTHLRYGLEPNDY